MNNQKVTAQKLGLGLQGDVASAGIFLQYSLNTDWEISSSINMGYSYKLSYSTEGYMNYINNLTFESYVSKLVGLHKNVIGVQYAPAAMILDNSPKHGFSHGGSFSVYYGYRRVFGRFEIGSDIGLGVHFLPQINLGLLRVIYQIVQI